MKSEKNQEILIKCKNIFPELFYEKVIIPIFPCLDNPATNQWILSSIDQALDILKNLKQNLKNEEDYKDVFTFFEDESIYVKKIIQDSKCNPFRAIKFNSNF